MFFTIPNCLPIQPSALIPLCRFLHKGTCCTAVGLRSAKWNRNRCFFFKQGSCKAHCPFVALELTRGCLLCRGYRLQRIKPGLFWPVRSAKIQSGEPKQESLSPNSKHPPATTIFTLITRGTFPRWDSIGLDSGLVPCPRSLKSLAHFY